MSLELIGYISKEPFLKKMVVKAIDFTFYSNKVDANITLKRILNLISTDCYAFPHNNKLYFIGNGEKLIEEIKSIGKNRNIVKDFSEEPSKVDLDPISNISDLVIARNLIYIGLKQTYKDKISKVPSYPKTNELKGEFYAKKIEEIDLGFTQKVEVYCGFKTKFDYTLDGRGIFWADVVFGAFNCKDKKWLSPKEIKKLGMSKKFREYSQPSPRIRYENTMKVFEEVFGNKNSFEIDMKDVGKLVFEKLKLH